MKNGELQAYLGQIGTLFSMEEFLSQDIGPSAIQTYYTRCAWVYGLLHSPAGAVHLALNHDGRYDPKGFGEQPRLVQVQLDTLHATESKSLRVLEIGSGKGFNSLVLARHNPQDRFSGLDLTPAHVAIARHKAGQQTNLTFHIGDYHALPFPDSCFDIVAGIECLCHASSLPRVLAEVFRVLRPGGRVVITDGFRRPHFDGRDDQTKLAARLVERSMAVERFWEIDVFEKAATAAGFRVAETKDLSSAIRPNLQRLQKIARLFFRFPVGARILTRLLPRFLIRHAVTGLLGAETLDSDAQGYYALMLERVH